MAQTLPTGMMFQAVARDASGNAAASRTIYAMVDVLQKSATGESVYTETHQVISNDDGIFTLIIGGDKGVRVSGVSSFSNLNWRSEIYFINLKIAIAPSLPTPGWDLAKEYVDMGTSQIWAVPYAFSAFKAVIADSATKLSGILSGESGGTGISNLGKTITLGRNLELKGFGNLIVNTTGPTNVTFPVKGTLISSESLDTLINKFLVSPTFLGAPKTPTADSSSNDGTVASTEFVKSAVGSQIGSVLKISDTLAMLSNRIERDTASLSKRINLKVNTLNAKIDSSLVVRGQALIDRDLTVGGNLILNSGLLFKDSLVVLKGARIEQSILAKSKLYVTDSILAKGNVLIDSNLTVGKDLEIKGNLILNKGLDFNDSLVVQKGARIEQSILAKSKLYVSDSILARGNVKIDGNLLVKGLNINDSVMKYDTSKVNVVDTAAMLAKYARRFTKNVKVVLNGRNLGKYNDGDSVYVKGKTLDDFLYDISTLQVAASYSAPSVSTNISTTSLEIGTRMDLRASISLSKSFNPGSAGLEATPSTAIYYKDGVSLGAGVTTDALAGTVSGSTRLLLSTITYQVKNVSFTAGTVKLDNLGNPSPYSLASPGYPAGSIDGSSVSITTFQNRYWGKSTTESISNYLQNTENNSTSKAYSLSNIVMNNEYIFFAYPSALNTVTTITLNGFPTIFNTYLQTFNNAQGYPLQYRIYVSPEKYTGTISSLIVQ